jgi:putative oxidoreductase
VHASTATAPSTERHAPGRAFALPDAVGQGVVALLARIGVGMTFWQSGQTKIEGFVLDPLAGRAVFGWPRLAPGTVDLFRHEYALPVLSPEWAALAAAAAEHLFPFLLVVGLATRLSAMALLAMTLVIQVFVYPSAYATHALWAACLLLLATRGAGPLSIDHWLASRRRR